MALLLSRLADVPLFRLVLFRAPLFRFIPGLPRADVLAAAKVLLERPYPQRGDLSTLPQFVEAGWNRLDFIGPNIGVYYFNPRLRNSFL